MNFELTFHLYKLQFQSKLLKLEGTTIFRNIMAKYTPEELQFRRS